MNIRTAPNVAAKIVGRHVLGDVIAARPVLGGLYHSPAGPSHTWLRQADGHYTAAGYYAHVR